MWVTFLGNQLQEYMSQYDLNPEDLLLVRIQVLEAVRQVVRNGRVAFSGMGQNFFSLLVKPKAMIHFSDNYLINLDDIIEVIKYTQGIN